MYMPILFIHSTGIGHFSCLHLLAVINNAAVNKCIQISDQVPAFTSSGFIPRSGIAESCGNLISYFSPF